MIWSILVFFFVLSLLVIVHEFGHFWVAKKNGIWVEEFGFGLPPRIYGKKIGETIYSINALPFGGFVRLHGEMTEDGVTKPNKAFLGKSLWVKTGVITAGVIMNFLLAVVAFGILYSHYGIPVEKGYVEIVGIVPDTPAANSNLVVGEKILAVDGIKVKESKEIISIVTEKGGKHKLTVENLTNEIKTERNIVIDTKQDKDSGKWYMGISLNSKGTYFPPLWKAPFYGAYYGTKDSLVWVGQVWNGLTGIAKDATQGKVSKDVSGPVGILAIIDRILKTGNIWDLINLIGIISVNLAVLNILPFPALDGGRLFFIVIESIFGKKVAPKIESVIHGVGMVILLAAMLLITFKDVRGLISAGSISGFLDNMTSK